MKLYLMIVSLLVGISACQQVVSADGLPRSVVSIMDKFLFNFVPKLLNQRPFNEFGTLELKHGKFALEDVSNEEIATASLQEIIARSGYKYENHYVLSEDGYITQLTRLINPLANACELKQPPVALFHGGVINPTAYVVASAIQHHPEKYPLPPGQMQTSSNRSLAFTLCNNGYDVWLVGTRGSRRENQGHKKYKLFQTSGFLSSDEWVERKKAIVDGLEEISQTFDYWNFSMDEITQFEIGNQVDKILEVTGAKQVAMFTFSLSTMYAIPALTINPKLNKKIHSLIVMAPIVNSKGANRLIRAVAKIGSKVDYKLGTVIVAELATSQIARDLTVCLAQNKDLRYTLLKAITGYICGSSAKFATNLEAPVLGHIFETTGFKMAQHYYQQMLAGRLQKFDYGLIRNEIEYGQTRPPIYDLSEVNLKRWMLVEAEFDNLATPESGRQFVREMKIPPNKRAFYPRGNHMDLFAGFENDKYVNLPILKFLDSHALPPLESHQWDINFEQMALQEQLLELVPADTSILRINGGDL